MWFFSFLFADKINLSTWWKTPYDDFLTDLKNIDMSEIHDEKRALKIVSQLDRDWPWWIEDDEQSRIAWEILWVLRIYTQKAIKDKKLTIWEFLVWKKLYEDLELFTEDLTINISKKEKNEVNSMFADIYELRWFDMTELRKIITEEVDEIAWDIRRIEHEKENEYIKSLSKEDKKAYLTELSRKNYEAAWLEYTPTLDKRTPFCPNCWEQLDKIPDRKKKCTHCRKQIYTYSKEISPWKWERHLTGEEEWNSYYVAIEDEKKIYQEYVDSGQYKIDKLDEIARMETLYGIQYNVRISGGGCEKCQWDRLLSLRAAYNIRPTCKQCGYWYTVTAVSQYV